MAIENLGLLAGGSGASTFLQLIDVPNSYASQGGKGVRVNAEGTALEFYTISGGGNVSASSDFVTDNRLIRSDGTLKNVQSSGITINDTDDISGAKSLSLSDLTASELIGSDGSKKVVSLAVATYPSLTEISYVKGLTSSAQTQITARQLILSEGAFVDGDKTKLNNIEANANVTDIENIANSINGATAKTTPVNADSFGIIDSEASNVGKKLTFTNLKAALKTYFDTLYSGGGSESLASHTASTVSNDAITYGFGKTNYIDGDAAIDFSLKIDESTIVDGGTMDVLYKANGANRVVSFATIFTTKLGTSMTVASGDTAHYKIKRVGSVYHLYLNGVT